MNEHDEKPEPRRPDWLGEEGDAAPDWAELPRLQVGDQASAATAERLAAEAESLKQDLIPTPPSVIVLADNYLVPPQAGPPRQQPVVYGIVVRNTTAAPMYEVFVEHELPPGPRYLGAEPPPQEQGRRLTWDLGTLEAGAARRLRITVQPNRPDELPPDAAALFRVRQCLHTSTRVLRPAVSVAVQLPDEAASGEQVPLAIEAHNAGPGAADDVRVVVPLPPGLTHPDGAVLQFARPGLAPGAHLYVEADLRIEHGGQFVLPVRVLGNGKVLASAEATLRAVGPLRAGADEPPPEAGDRSPGGAGPPQPAAPAGRAPSETAEVPTAYVLFMLAEVCYALPARRVSVASRRAVPPGIRLLDLRQRLRMPTEGPGARVLLVRGAADAPEAGLVVDRAVGVRRLRTRSASYSEAFVAATAEYQGERVVVLDLDRLLQSP